MIKKAFYKINEVADLLGVDIETMFQTLSSYLCLLDMSAVLEVHTASNAIEIYRLIDSSYWQQTDIDIPSTDCKTEDVWALDYLFTQFNKIESDTLTPDSYNDLFCLRELNKFNLTGKPRVFHARLVTPDSARVVLLTQSSDLIGAVSISDLMVPCAELLADLSFFVIPSSEVDRMLSSKQPTLESLQEEISLLRAELDRLKSESVPVNQTKQEQRVQCLKFWGEGKGYSLTSKIPMKIPMNKQDVQAALMKVDSNLFGSNFDEFWKAQRIYQLESGRPKKT